MAITIDGSSAAGNIDLGTNGTITDLAVGGLPDGSVNNADLAADVATSLQYDDTKLKRDLNILALHTAIDNNKTAHSLENTFIEQFEDSSKITLTNAGRSTASEFIGTVNPNVIDITEGIAGGNGKLGSDDQAGASSYTGYDGVTRAYGQMTGGWEADEGFNLKHIFAAGVDFEVIISVRGTYQSVGYLHGTGITSLSELDYASSNSDWDTAAGVFDDYPDTFYAQYHAPFNGDGANDWRNLYRWSRVSNNFTLQWLGRNTTDITINDTNIAALRTSSVAASGDVEDIGADVTLANKMVIGFGEGGPSDTNRFIKIELANYGTPSTSATGTCESAAITAPDARTKVSGVILYKDEKGTATLGTDLKVSFSCDNGSNYTALDSTAGNYTAGADFSTGIKTAYVKEVTCTSGTQIKYKVEWANQADGTKETQLHGIGVNY